MSRDVSNIAEKQASQNKSVEHMPKNSKATRYAAEAVQKHIEETKKYYDIK